MGPSGRNLMASILMLSCLSVMVPVLSASYLDDSATCPAICMSDFRVSTLDDPLWDVIEICENIKSLVISNLPDSVTSFNNNNSSRSRVLVSKIRVIESFSVVNCSGLRSFAGWDNLRKVGTLNIDSNYNLVTLSPLGATLRNISNLIIENNHNLKEWGQNWRINHMKFIYGSVRISKNPSIDSLDLMYGVRGICGNLTISYNNNLVRVSALASLRFVNGSSIVVRDNLSLVDVSWLLRVQCRVNDVLVSNNPIMCLYDVSEIVKDLGFDSTSLLTYKNELPCGDRAHDILGKMASICNVIWLSALSTNITERKRYFQSNSSIVLIIIIIIIVLLISLVIIGVLFGIYTHRKVPKEYSEAISNILEENGENISLKRDEVGLGIIHYAAMRDDIKAFDGIIEKYSSQKNLGHIIDFTDANGDSPLIHAVRNSSTKIFNKLMEFGTNLGNESNSGMTALAMACEVGNLMMVATLLKQLANANSRSGNTYPLIIAVGNGHKNVVQLLLDNGADVNCETESKMSPLELATKLGNIDMVELLLQYSAKVNHYSSDTGRQALHYASACNDIEIAEMLIQKGANVDSVTAPHGNRAGGETPLILAQKENHPDMVQLLLQHGAAETNSMSMLCHENVNTSPHNGINGKDRLNNGILSKYKRKHIKSIDPIVRHYVDEHRKYLRTLNKRETRKLLKKKEEDTKEVITKYEKEHEQLEKKLSALIREKEEWEKRIIE